MMPNSRIRFPGLNGGVVIGWYPTLWNFGNKGKIECTIGFFMKNVRTADGIWSDWLLKKTRSHVPELAQMYMQSIRTTSAAVAKEGTPS